MTRRRIGELATGFAIIMPQPIAMYWILFSLVAFPWILPADHSGSIVEAYENAATAGIGLAVVSCLTPLWAAGMFGRRLFGWCFGLVSMFVQASASLWLYPSDEPLSFLPMRSFAHVAGMVAVALGLAGFRLSRSAVRGRQIEPRTV
jgi:hypothetical protein